MVFAIFFDAICQLVSICAYILLYICDFCYFPDTCKTIYNRPDCIWPSYIVERQHNILNLATKRPSVALKPESKKQVAGPSASRQIWWNTRKKSSVSSFGEIRNFHKKYTIEFSIMPIYLLWVQAFIYSMHNGHLGDIPFFWMMIGIMAGTRYRLEKQPP